MPPPNRAPASSHGPARTRASCSRVCCARSASRPSTSYSKTKRASRSGRLARPDEQAGGLLLVKGALVAAHAQRELAAVGLAHLDVRAGDEALVVVPVQEFAVVLGQAD